ncbi:hypothetical protein [Kitasatospora sp. NPDC004272]
MQSTIEYRWSARTTESAGQILWAAKSTLRAYAVDAGPDRPFSPEAGALPVLLAVELMLPLGAVGQDEPVRHEWRVTSVAEARRILDAAEKVAEGYRGVAMAAGASRQQSTPLSARVALVVPEQAAIESASPALPEPPRAPRRRRALLGSLRG